MVDGATYRQCLILFEQPGAIAAVDVVAEGMGTTKEIARECLKRMQVEGRICGFRDVAHLANREDQPPKEAAMAQEQDKELALIEKAIKRVGIKSLLGHGAGSLVHSDGVDGVTQEDLLAYTREIALHCAVALAAPQPNAALADGWVSVDERLPEDGVEVLCAGVGWGEAFVMACYYDEGRREWYPINTHWTDATGTAQYPTHWRLLPAPPTLNASKEGSGHG